MRSVIFIFLILPLLSSAQKLTVKAVKNISGDCIMNIENNNQNGFYGVKYKAPYVSEENPILNKDKTGIFLEKYDNDLNLIFSKEIFLPASFSLTLNHKSILVLKNSIILFNNYYDKKKDSTYCYGLRLDTNGLIKENVFLDQIYSRNLYDQGEFDFNVSADRAFFLICHKSTIKNEGQAHFKCYDDQLKLLYSKIWTIPPQGFYSKINYLDNKCNIHIVRGRPALEKGVGDYTLSTISYYYKEDKFNITNYDLGEKINQYAKHNVDGNGMLTYHGIYFDWTTKKPSLQFYKFDLYAKKQLSALDVTLPENFLVPEKSTFNEPFKRYEYDYKKTYYSNDGEIIPVLEYHYSTFMQSPNGVTGAGWTLHLHRNINPINMSPEGKINWTADIPKDQSLGINYNGNFHFYKDGKLFFLYNDHEKYVESNFAGKPNNIDKYKQVQVVVAIVDEAGKVTRKALGTPKGFMIHAKDNVELLNGFILRGMDENNKQSLIKVEF